MSAHVIRIPSWGTSIEFSNDVIVTVSEREAALCGDCVRVLRSSVARVGGSSYAAWNTRAYDGKLLRHASLLIQSGRWRPSILLIPGESLRQRLQPARQRRQEPARLDSIH